MSHDDLSGAQAVRPEDESGRKNVEGKPSDPGARNAGPAGGLDPGGLLNALLDGGGALEVGSDQEWIAALLLEPAGQLGRGGRLARALQAGQQDDRRRTAGVGDLERLAAQDRHQLLVDDLDDLLARAQRLGELESDAPGPHRVGEGTDDTDLDVSLQQGGADLAEDLVDVRLAQAATAPEAGEDPLESVGQALEHGLLRLQDGERNRDRRRPARRTPARARRE